MGLGSQSHVAGSTSRPLHWVQQLPEPASGETGSVLRVQIQMRHGVGHLVADLLLWIVAHLLPWTLAQSAMAKIDHARIGKSV